MRSLPDNNLRYPVLIEFENGGSGSGFFYTSKTKIYLVTALHVIEDDKGQLRGTKITLTCYDNDIKIDKPIEIHLNLEEIKIRKKSNIDIALIEIGNISTTDSHAGFLEGVSTVGSGSINIVVVPQGHLKKFNEVLVSNDVYVLGFPSSLGSPNKNQIEYKKPLLRKGIIAGLNNTNQTIIIDCPIYFGNSGGIAIEAENINFGNYAFRVIGVVSEYIPFIEKLISLQHGYQNLNVENSGYAVVVPIDTIEELTNEAPIEINNL